MITLSYGFKRPETGDKGSLWFPALEDDITQLNSHDHDGVNSTKLTAASFTGITQAVNAAGWAATSGGTYRQLITVPASVTYDDFGIQVRVTNGASAGAQIYPSIEKVSDTTYYIYVNDNTLTLSVLYLA